MQKATKRQLTRRTEKEKPTLIEQWEKSGLPIKTFCNQHQFSDSLFHGWLNKYARTKKGIPPKKDFVPLQLASAARTQTPLTPYAEVVLASGHRITLYQPVNLDVLRGLLSS